MAKLFKLFGRKAPHPPRPDYTGDQFTRSADDEFARFVSPRDSHSDQNGRGDSGSASAQGSIEGGSYSRTNGSVSRRTGHRGTDGDTRTSPSSNTRPIIAEDYSDPKDVVRAAQQSGVVIPPETPDHVARPPEDDYSVPYDAQKVIEQIKQAGGQKRAETTEDSDMGNTMSSQASFKQSTSSRSHQYEEPPPTGFLTPSSPGVNTTDDYADDEESDQYMDSNNLPRLQDRDQMRDDSSMSEASENNDNLRVTRSFSAHQRLQTPQNDPRIHGEYDNPWEWKIKPPEQPAKGGGGGHISYHPQPHGPLAESPRFRSRSDAMHLRGRTSPESDIRPHDEYDQPWEWMKNKPKQSHSMIREKENIPSNHSTSENRRGGTRKTSQGLKLDISPMKQQSGEIVDPKIPLEEQKWYHGKLSRIDAEKKLKSQRECSYLVRQSESAARDFSLSLKSTKGFMHMKIIEHDEGFILGEFSKPFKTIPEMISYYTAHKLNIKGAAHMALLHPVTIEML